NPLDVLTILERLLRNQFNENNEGESIDAAFVEDQPFVESAPLASQTPSLIGLTSTTNSSASTVNVSGYLAGVLEKTNPPVNLLNEKSVNVASETQEVADEFLDFDNTYEFQLIDSANNSTFMSEEMESV